jgi:tryptophan halogenase
MKKIAIIGAGSAGILTTCHMLAMLPLDWEVSLIHDPSIGIVGIGESTNPAFCNMLAVGLDFNLYRDIEPLDGTHKFGTLFKGWREKDIINPLIGGSCAIHFDTYKLKEFSVTRLKQKWKNRFKEIQGTVNTTTNNGNKVDVDVNGSIEKFDYIIECTGFPNDYTEYTICKDPVNHCLVHNIPVGADWGYTGHKATKNGWMFEIPLTTRQSYGYLFNDTITSVEDAKADFSEIIGVPVNELNNTEYKFKSYYANSIVNGRIFKNGNNALFFEPMSANSLWAYFQTNLILFEYIMGNIRDPKQVNEMFINNAKAVEEILWYFYHGGTNIDSEFWKQTTEWTSEKLKTSAWFLNAVGNYTQMRQNNVPIAGPQGGWIFSPYNLHLIDRDFGYNYFS